jgi:hypothetical protein
MTYLLRSRYPWFKDLALWSTADCDDFDISFHTQMVTYLEILLKWLTKLYCTQQHVLRALMT